MVEVKEKLQQVEDNLQEQLDKADVSFQVTNTTTIDRDE